MSCTALVSAGRPNVTPMTQAGWWQTRRLQRRRRRVQLWAQQKIAQGAVVIDTETTDLFGRVIEIAAVDADGRVLFESLVNPGCPIEPGAFEVHGISDQDVADAPGLLEVLPHFLAATDGRPLLAYNAPYDREVLRADLERLQRRSAGLTAPRRWGCLMEARSAVSGGSRVRLDAGHRAAGDAIAAAALLRALAAGVPETMSAGIADTVAPGLAPQPGIARPVAPTIADGPSG